MRTLCLLIAGAVVCSHELWIKNDLLVLALVAPAILAAAAYGLFLLVRSILGKSTVEPRV